MGNAKSISIRFDPEDMEELREFMRWRMQKDFVSIDSRFDLKTANDLIRQAKIDKAQALRRIEAQRGAQQELEQQREDVSLLPDREAEKIQADWIKEAEASALAYVTSRNKGATPRSTQGVDPDLFRSTLSWIEKQRGRNWWPKKAK